MFKKTMKIKGALRTPAVKEVLDNNLKTEKKYLKRHDIEKNVFDLHDSVADNAKMISLLFSVVSRIWESMPDEQKNNIPQEERDLIDQAIQEFKNTTTWADRLFAEQGSLLIERLFSRQKDVGDILGS